MRSIARTSFVIRLTAATLCTATLITTVPAMADSLWRDGVSRPMFADKRAANVGDIITIVVQENATATKDNTTKTARSSGVDATIDSFFFNPSVSHMLTTGGKLPALKFDGKSEYSGGGSINNSEKIVARVAVRVVDVLPNGNLVIEGTRETSFSGEQQTIILRGVVRPDDIMSNNSVYSYNVADATIKFVAKGTISNSQRKGWFQKLWDAVGPF